MSTPTTTTPDPDPLHAAHLEVEKADLAAEAAAEKAEELRAKVEELREEVRDGKKIPRKTIADAEGEADHAELEAEAARRAMDKVREERRLLRIEDAKARLVDTSTVDAVVELRTVISAAVARLHDLVEVYNSIQSTATSELAQLAAPGYSASHVRADRYDLSEEIAKAVLDGLGGDGAGDVKLRRASTHTEFATALRNQAVYGA